EGIKQIKLEVVDMIFIEMTEKHLKEASKLFARATMALALLLESISSRRFSARSGVQLSFQGGVLKALEKSLEA
ncbi:hypothetical protein, partial [Eubacterium callanderi]|uniref:hypothetical protein n=1 Tax=Eubacterium callanderi TaxID=53442 RepID=UPI00210AF999